MPAPIGSVYSFIVDICPEIVYITIKVSTALTVEELDLFNRSYGAYFVFGRYCTSIIYVKLYASFFYKSPFAFIFDP